MFYSKILKPRLKYIYKSKAKSDSYKNVKFISKFVWFIKLNLNWHDTVSVNGQWSRLNSKNSTVYT